ncbi:MAG: hydrogenase expression/formation protein HypE [Candidatus Sigynarchaeota archaeon]
MTSNTGSHGGSIDEAGSVTLAHGAGGLMTKDLIEFLIKNIAKKNVHGGIGLVEMDDGATVPIPGTDRVVVVTTDGHTVDPIFFPGGDLGKLAVCGTLNDLLMMNADPVALTHAIIVEEGFPIKELKRINDSLVSTANDWGIAIIAGDTKVMPRGTLRGVVSVTTGIGIAKRGDVIVDNGVQPGDDILVTGTLGDHGTALLAVREGLSFETELVSDVQVLANVVNIARKFKPRAMTDPTRGGLAVALNEIAAKSRVSIWIDEDKIPFQKATVAACEMLGLSPYELASEGRAVIAVPGGQGDALVAELRQLPEGKDAALIGHTAGEKPGKVFLRTRVGGTRILAMPLGEPIPRVC